VKRGEGNTNSPESSLLKFLPLAYHHSHFLAATLDFTSLFMTAFLGAAYFFYSWAVFGLDVILLDFCKAFNKVSHRLLLHKLDHYGIRSLTFKWISSFLSRCSQRVVCNGFTSVPVNAASNVLQGTALGPLLFLVYKMTYLISSPHVVVCLLMIACCIDE